MILFGQLHHQLPDAPPPPDEPPPPENPPPEPPAPDEPPPPEPDEPQDPPYVPRLLTPGDRSHINPISTTMEMKSIKTANKMKNSVLKPLDGLSERTLTL